MSTIICIPESILNEIFEYLSHITDSGWILRIDRKGKLCLVARDTFTNINHINFQKRHSIWYAGSIKLLADKGGANWDLQPVPAISQPMLSDYESVMYANYAQGFFYRNMCIQYDDPETGSHMIAYVDLRVNHNYGEEEVVFHQGCVYDDHGNSFVITGYGSDGYLTKIAINPFNIILDTTGDERTWDEIVEEMIANGDEHTLDEIAEEIGDEDEDEDVFGEHPLDMYM